MSQSDSRETQADLSQSVSRPMSEVRATAWAIQRQWRQMLGAKVEPPPYSPERQTAWRAGYEDALRDLATMRAEGRTI